MDKSSRNASDYAYTGGYDKERFTNAYRSAFASVTKFNQPSIPDLLFVVGKIGADKAITDVRWAAYMLATMFIETSHTIKLRETEAGPHGQTKVRTTKVWRNFVPVEEAGHGKGRAYFLPVKVERLPDGAAKVTEWDGDQWIVSVTGFPRKGQANAIRGLKNPAASASRAYLQANGQANQYFGRGYVQLTWWDNYISAGLATGQGLRFLFEPDRMLDRDLAYSIMSIGMTTGRSFANGRKFPQYFIGGHTDYVSARNIVNGGATLENKKEVADIAARFEEVLFSSRIQPGAKPGI